MQQLLLVLQVLLAAGIIALVLLQQGRGADAGASFGGGSSGSLFGSRGPATFLAKATGLVAALFFINSIGLAYLASRGRVDHSIVETLGTQSESLPPSLPQSLPAQNPSTTTDVPTAPGSDSTETSKDIPAVPGESTQKP